MKLNNLSLKDKVIFNKFLGLNSHQLSVYAFENIYIWKGLFDIYWTVIEGSLSIFFKDKLGCFLYISPLAKKVKPGVPKEVFKVLDSFNKNKAISRIENVEENELSFYLALGYECKEKSVDYLCRRTDLVRLKGNKFKSKRASFNYFIKHYSFEYLPFSPKYSDDCLKLYKSWMENRKKHNSDSVYQGMLEDSLKSLRALLDAYSSLACTGRIIRIDKQVKGFTFGFSLSRETFCILYEITDLTIKGISQYIFSKFCSELKGFKYINIMDDSGLDNLKQVKLSYQPLKLIPAYIVARKNG
jgi:hypothetical protein